MRAPESSLLRPHHVLATAVAALVAIAIAHARAPRGPDVHRPDADCRGCHDADAAVLRADSSAARTRLLPDLESRCMNCHAAQGPSHRTGMAPRGNVAAGLPLANGHIACATCHFVHGEGDRGRDFVRIDNRRGGLCLTCHTLSELQ